MKIKPIDDDVYVCGQIAPTDIPALKEFGIATIICNRPDDEEADQPSFEEIKRAADEVGIATFHVPVVPMGIAEEDLIAMRDALEKADKPLLAFCRSGGRSSTIYSLVMDTQS